MGGRRRCILINANEDADGLVFAGGNPRTGTALSFFLPIYQEITQNITIIRTYRGPMKFIEKTDIKLSAISDTASTIGLAEVRGWLEKN